MKQAQDWINDHILHGIIAIAIFILSYAKVIVTDNINMFMAILFVVAFDWIIGVALAVKSRNFETRKAIKIVWYLSSYWLLLFMLLSVEKASPAAFFLSEAVILPILVFQIISSAKNMELLGLIKSETFKAILKNVDKHKEQSISENK